MPLKHNLSYKTADVIVGNSINDGCDYAVASNVDAASKIQEAVDFIENNYPTIFQKRMLLLRGDFLFASQVQITNSGLHIENIGTLTKDASWQTTGLSPQGFFRVGLDDNLISNISITLRGVKGTCFSTFPTKNAGENEHILAVFSNAAVQNSNFDIEFENIGCPIRFNKLGCVDGTPSKAVRIKVKGKQCVVGAEAYCNGYEMEDIAITSSDIHDCLDDLAAMVANNGGIPGASGKAINCGIHRVSGSRNSDASRGGGCAKLDEGVGQMVNCFVDFVNVTSTTGVNEGGVAIFSANAAETSDFYIGTVIVDNLDYGVWYQGNGYNVTMNKILGNAKYGAILQSTRTPVDLQSITINTMKVSAKDGATQDGAGVVYCCGVATQGFRNVTILDGQFENKTIPINEGSTNLPTDIASGVVAATVQNTEYNLDTRNRDIADCDFTSTNRYIKYKKNGVIPTSSSGLPTGTVYNNSGVLTIA